MVCSSLVKQRRLLGDSEEGVGYRLLKQVVPSAPSCFLPGPNAVPRPPNVDKTRYYAREGDGAVPLVFPGAPRGWRCCSSAKDAAASRARPMKSCLLSCRSRGLRRPSLKLAGPSAWTGRARSLGVSRLSTPPAREGSLRRDVLPTAQQA